MEGLKMGSPHNRRIYSDTTLFSLELAMRDVWEVLKAHAPRSDWENVPELQNVLAEMMLDLVDSGVTDPHELRSKTLENFNFKPPQ
jgi:hypothetical protein